MDNMNKKIKPVFCSMIAVFVLTVFLFSLTLFDKGNFPVVAVLGLLLTILGIVLAVVSWKEKGILRVFLIITGFSAAGILIFSVLHNFFYALGVLSGNIALLSSFMEILHAASFIISLIVCPILFLVGVIGSIIIFGRKNAVQRRK